MYLWTESPQSAVSTESAVEDVLHHGCDLQITLRDPGHDRTDDKDNYKYQYEIRAFVHGCQDFCEEVVEKLKEVQRNTIPERAS